MIVGAFTFVLAIATAFLYRATRNLVESAEATAERQLRAYLGVIRGSVMSSDGGNTFIVQIEIINSGQTPAHQVRHCIAAELQIQHAPALTFPMPERVPGEWVMVPNVAFTLKRDIAIGGASGTQTIDVGQRVIFTWGRVDYIDAFDRPQHFDFRYRSLRPIRARVGDTMRTVGWELETEDHGNTAT